MVLKAYKEPYEKDNHHIKCVNWDKVLFNIRFFRSHIADFFPFKRIKMSLQQQEEKKYDPLDTTLTFVNRKDDLDPVCKTNRDFGFISDIR